MSAPSERRAVIGAVWAVALAAFALAFTRVSDPDLGFHLATGRAVLALHRIPATNILSFTEPDHPWILHEWLPGVIFELAFRKAGPAGVLAVKLAAVVATWPLVALTACRLGARPLSAALATILGAGAAATRFTERPQIFSNLALAAVALLLATASRAPAARTRVRLVVAAGLVAAITAHVHAGAITSIALLVAVAAGIAIEPLRARVFGDEERAFGVASPRLAAAHIAAVAAGAVALAAMTLAIYHPHGARPLLVPFQLGSDPYLAQHVVEYRSPLGFPFAALRVFWVFGAIVVALVAARVKRTPAALLVPFALFVILALRHTRTIDAFAVVAAPVLAVSLEGLAGDRLASRPARAIQLGLLALLAVGLPIDRWGAYPPGAGIVEAVWPVPMFRFIEEQHLVGPAFVSDGWAGPFLARFYPAERAFFDPRYEAYSPGFARDVYQHVRYGEPGWDEQLDHYGVQLVLLKYTTPGEARFQGGRENLRQLLAKSPAWSLVGFGDTGELFVRRDGPNADAATRLAIPGVEPDRGMFFGKPARSAAPLVRAVDRGFHDSRILALAAVAVADAGDRALAEALLKQAEAARPGDARVLDARAAISSGAGHKTSP